MKIKKLNENLKTDYKNVLIITNTRDNLGSHVAFVKDIDDIKEPDLKEMVLNCLNDVDYEKDNNFWSNSGTCGSEREGYAFNDYSIGFAIDLPVTVEHIVNYVF